MGFVYSIWICMNFHSERKSWDRYLLTIERLGWDPLVTGGIHISILGVDSLQTSIFGKCFLLNLQML